MINSQGTLQIRAYTAGGALPVPNARVQITGADETNRLISYSLITDMDGITDAVTLPTPSVDYSLSPTPAEAPYAIYDVVIDAEGYYIKRINGVNVFSGVNSLQQINMIPISSDGKNDFPRGNVNTNIPNNENL